MKIVDIQTSVYRIPPAIPWEDATHSVLGIEYILTRISTDSGVEGIGISYTVGVGGTAVKTLIDDYLANMVIGKDPCSIEEIWKDAYGQLKRCGDGGINTLAIAAIDVGLWDIQGKVCRKPVHKLLGGCNERIPVYASGIDFHLDIPELLELMRSYLAEGYSVIKMKVGKNDISEDMERICKVKEVLGPRRKLLVDANQAWSASQAVQSCKLLDRLGLGWIEEPMSSLDLAGHAELKRKICTPVAVGESLYYKHQFRDYLQNNAVDFIQADIARVGGITEWVKIAHLADAWHKPMAPHYLMELSLQVLCGVPNGYILENVKGGSLSELGVVKSPVRIADGYGYPSSEPGHGIQFNYEILEKYKVDASALRNVNLRSRK